MFRRKTVGAVLSALITLGVLSPVANAQPDQVEPVAPYMGTEQSDYVPDRNEPSVEDQLAQYELGHPEEVA